MLLTSIDSKILCTVDILWQIELIKKLLIEIDLSESTLIVFLNAGTLLFKIRLKLSVDIFKKIESQNNV